MPISQDQFEAYEALILSEQIPQDELLGLLKDNPDFAAWYRERATTRRVSSTDAG